MTPPRRSRGGALLALALLVATIPLPPPAAADPIEEKRAEAARIARQLEEQSRQVSVLAEDLNEARLRAGRLDEKVAEARDRVARTEEEVRRVRDRLRGQVVDAYVRGGAAQALELLMSSEAGSDIAIRHAYVKTATASSRETIDELRAARLRFGEERDRLDEAREAAEEALDGAEASRAEAAAAAAAQRETLARVQGELAVLVAEEARRRAEEEARRVQAELAARRQREAREREEEAERARERAAAATTAPPPAARRPQPVTTTVPPPQDGQRRAPAAPPHKGADAAVAEARRQLGKPYEYGAAGPDSFDCSGLTSWAWRAGGRSLPHSSRAQFSSTARVDVSEVLPGDLLFYGDPIHHVGIYVGNGQMIEASETGTPVRYASIYRRDLAGVGRVY